jgi:hypothetical protein
MSGEALDHFCRNCSHMTRPIGVGVCLFCKSPNIGIHQHTGPIPQSRAMGIIPEPEDREPTKHQRLKAGFAILEGEWG